MSDRVFLPTPSPRGSTRGGADATPPDLPPALSDGRRDLLDRYGRQARDLRVSLTDRCNLRCTYCMPAEGLEWMPTAQTLSDDETIRLIRIAVTHLGIRQVRFTGGEPLLRKSLEKIIAATTQLRTDEKLPPSTALTTNGLGLPRRLDGLIEAGLDRVNISLDTIDPELYARLTRRDRLGDVFAAIEAATAAHREGRLGTVKVNAVVMPGVNEEDIVPLARYCLERGAQLRFIEQMPLGPREEWERSRMVTAEDILARLGEEFELTPVQKPRGSAPAALWTAQARDGLIQVGRIGVIASVTRPFCGNCDRTRLTADGAVRNCLFGNSETSLRDLLRSGASDAELAAAWAGEMWKKLPGHGVDDEGFLQPDRPMSAIGG
ncbi:GTP 3',8-cyclase MoaA [Corynebacterium guaraldiae]|uniref:GTP 3',8-cyclase MoaA n=1 Tax=Corynebacterium guaraldiae TaxID=3051103 RepID=UPI0011853D93|nr:GTP 3',8-cyclase MoaA [Corynebacterium guaraldiae]TRX51688.1 GTP 3',8-cyclase MoaA [Corynebacterium guaraldiae]